MARQVGRIATWIIAAVLLVAGPVMFSQGQAGFNEVRSQLAAEQITFGDDAKELVGRTPGEKVDTGAEAKDFARIINAHVEEATQGKTYAEMDREDPKREMAAKGAALRTSLNTAYLAEMVATLVMALGGLVFLVGLGLVGATLRKE